KPVSVHGLRAPSCLVGPRSGYCVGMDAITLLKDDHHTVEQLFKRFEKAGDKAHVQKRQIVDRIIEELSVHAAVEEQVFYPVARATVSETETIALESLEEHHVVKWLLSELQDMDPAHERFDAKVTVLIESVRHHVQEEEGDFFPKVRKHLGRNELADLGETLADAKKSAPTKPHPRMPDSGPVNVVAGAITGVVDRVGDNLGGIAQGSVNAAQDLIARITGSDRPKVSPTGSSTTRKRATGVRSAASTAANGLKETARTAKTGAASTAKAAKSGVKGTATTAKKSTSATATTAKRAATTTGRTARAATKKTTSTAKRTASNTAAAASGSR
ncbi:MAG TPA: hemerythrin domain-containing protein, partial [Ilumatobacter sp.]|nr:hemerythrin domain-containing protein [Ilumatobacter sp.]